MKASFFSGILSALGGAIMAACAPVNLLNAVTPSGSYSKAKDIPYGQLERQKLDIYKAEKPKINAPVIVFVHGGSWSEGTKDIYKFLAQAFTSRGYDIAVPNYRLFPEARFPDMIVDTAKAIAFISRRYEDRPLIVMGHSAGAYNALMATLDKSYLAAEGVSACERIAGIISLSGPTGAYELKKEEYVRIFPDRFLGSDAPLAHTVTSSPSIFAMNGGDDTTVGPKNAEALAEAIRARGGEVTLKIYDGFGHITPVRNLSKHFDGGSPYKADLFAFIEGLPANGNFCR